MIRHDPATGVTLFACARPQKCQYCNEASTILCEHPMPAGTCDTPLCANHAWKPNVAENKHYCRMHRRRIEEAGRAEQAHAEKEKKAISTLIHFPESKYSGFCKDKDCSASWQAGDPCWWDRETRLTYCEDCGDALSA